MYLLKNRTFGGKTEIIITDDDHLRVFYVEKHKTKRIHRVKVPQLGIDGIREMEHAGWIRSRLNIRTFRGDDRTKAPTNQLGHRISQGGAHCDKTAAGVKSVIRRLRPQEAERIAAVDDEITALTEKIAQLRNDRASIVGEAWTRANVVRVGDLVEKIKEPTR